MCTLTSLKYFFVENILNKINKKKKQYLIKVVLKNHNENMQKALAY